VSAAAPLLFQGGEVEGTPAYQRLELMARYYWEVCGVLTPGQTFDGDGI